MSLIIASIISRKQQGAGLMVYDLRKSEAAYVQLLNFESIPTRLHQLRGISVLADRLYAVVPGALLIFRIQTKGNGPLFILEKTVLRPDWFLGKEAQGDLHAVHASPSRNCLFVSFNSQCAVDVLDLDGNFLERQYLWEIAPDIFPLPTKIAGNSFQFGVVRHIFEAPDGEVLLTTALLNGTLEGGIISYDDGRMVLGPTPQPPHGGLFFRNKLAYCDIRQAEIPVYEWSSRMSIPANEPNSVFRPEITDMRWQDSEQAVRGMTCIDEHLLCGVFYLGRPKKTQIPPRMVEFDLETGKQVSEHFLPSFKGLEGPMIYALLPASPEIEAAMAVYAEPRYFRGDEPFAPEWVKPPQEMPEQSPEKGTAETGGKAVTPVEDQSGVKENTKSEETESEIQAPSDLHCEAPQLPVVERKPTVVLDGVSVKFVRSGKLMAKFSNQLRKKRIHWALRGVSFSVFEGEVLGIIGRNGSGKSTMSMVCAGVYQPDEGKITVQGRVQLLALGVGFKNELSGRENVVISGSLMGLSRREILAKMDEVEEFAELGDFMDEPVRTYSSGMRSRLGFAVATAVQPDILILDEIMATGDRAFQDKAMNRMKEMRSLARSVIIVSHAPGQLRKLCDKVLWLEKGRTVMLGETKEVLNAYDNFCQNPEKWLIRHQRGVDNMD